MVQQAIKKAVTILPGGRIELQAPELKAGMLAEVVILLPGNAGKGRSLSSIIGQGKGAYSTPEEADKFIRKERDEWE